MTLQNARIAVCIPARDQMHTATAFHLYNLAHVLTKLGIDHKAFVSHGTLIANQRHELVCSAKEWGATHVMFIDSDIEFQPEHVIKLLEFDEPIVAAAYSKRVEPIITTAWTKIDDWSTHVDPLKQTDSHIRVQAIALGFCLIKITVFDQVSLPWFQLGFHNGEYTGEDIEFFRKCNQEKIPVWMDVQTTLELGHLGTKSFRVAPGVTVNLAT
jgi:hypothetical protein